MHDTQLPELHTRFVPHEVPFATFPCSTQTATPVLHVVVPVRHGRPVTVQLAPTLHAPHAPTALRGIATPLV